MTQSTAKPKVRARKVWLVAGCENEPLFTVSPKREWPHEDVEKYLLPADPASIKAMELQIATALQKNDDVWKNAPVEGYLPDARAALAAVGIK